MSKFTGAVYGPPSRGLPELAVILREGKVVVAQAVPNIVAGEKFIEATLVGLEKLQKLAEEEDDA